MKPNHLLLGVVSMTTIILAFTGCEPTQPNAGDNVRPTPPVVVVNEGPDNSDPLEPAVNLTAPAGWTKSDKRPLPIKDHGFTIAYDHESGLAVTFYQFTRGQNQIANDLTSLAVQQEMENAKTGIQQAVGLGLWQSAEEVASKTVVLGDSKQQALWAQHELVVGDTKAISDTYVWAANNRFIKLRCTSRDDELKSHKAALKTLLTSLGAPTGKLEHITR